MAKRVATPLRVALVQMRCEKGAMDENLAVTRAYLDEAAGRGAAIVCFPEASLTGYVDPTRYPDAILRLDSPTVARFVAMTGEPGLAGVTALAGIVEENPEQPGGLPLLTQIVAARGKLLGVYRKRTIPDEEAHLFAPASAPTVFAHAAVMFGVAICADIETPAVFADAARLGARLVFECAAPGLYGDQETRDWASGHAWWRGECETKLGRYARENGIAIAVATQAGRTCDEDFPGGGYVFGLDGTLLAATPDWREGVLYADVPLG
jgi:predicted amidohydrolase